MKELLIYIWEMPLRDVAAISGILAFLGFLCLAIVALNRAIQQRKMRRRVDETQKRVQKHFLDRGWD